MKYFLTLMLLVGCTDDPQEDICSKPLSFPPDRPILIPASINQDQSINLTQATYLRAQEYMLRMDSWTDEVLKREALCKGI